MLKFIESQVTSDSFVTVFFVLLIIGYFIYKEYPGFKQRMLEKHMQDNAEAVTNKELKIRLDIMEKKVNDHQEMLSRDYTRLASLEDSTELNRRTTRQALEEMELMIEGMAVLLGAIEEVGIESASAGIKTMQKKLNDYLNRRAHEAV